MAGSGGDDQSFSPADEGPQGSGGADEGAWAEAEDLARGGAREPSSPSDREGRVPAAPHLEAPSLGRSPQEARALGALAREERRLKAPLRGGKAPPGRVAEGAHVRTDGGQGADRAQLPRRYPRMRSLLKNPELVPEGSDPLPEPRAPPVPGTFIPRWPPLPPRPDPAELDPLLALMADGLLIGRGEGGATEVRVTLKDEFFAGTELRISVADKKVAATLVPPTREIYWQLSGEAGELRARLEARGLRVAELAVLEPT